MRTMEIGGIALIAALALCAAHVGCSGSSSGGGGGSADGESCARTDDCQSGLACIANTCTPKGGSQDGGEGTTDGTVATGDSAGADGHAPDGTIAGGDAGSGGQAGNACQTSRDCAANLQCVATSTGGVCTLVNYGLTPTGKACTGECMTAADCCELPVNLPLCTYYVNGICYSQTTVATCQDIVQIALGGNPALCTSSADAGPTATLGCFYYQTYCQCTANTWACNNNKCSYTAPCANSLANQPGGCASLSRTRLPLPTSCDPGSARCQSSTTGLGCGTGTDCNEGGITVDTYVTCRGGDCTCHGSGCYLKCTKDLDCQAGFTCDTNSNLCVQGACTTDQQCVVQLGNTRAKCVSGACSVQCTNDHDCSPAGGTGQGSFNGRICDPVTKLCVPLGCTADIDCAATSGNVRTFCVPAPDAGTGIVVRSAITN